MKHDPFWKQKSTKSSNKYRILSALGERGLTFGELQKTLNLSPPVLSNYVRELRKEELIIRQVNGRRIEYVLTDKGVGRERIRRESIAKAFQIIGQMARDHSSAKSLLEMAEFAKAEPKLFDGLMQWMTDYMTCVMSDETLRWMKKHGDTTGKLLHAEVMKKLAPYIKAKHSLSEPMDVILPFQTLLHAMQEVVSEKR